MFYNGTLEVSSLKINADSSRKCKFTSALHCLSDFAKQPEVFITSHSLNDLKQILHIRYQNRQVTNNVHYRNISSHTRPHEFTNRFNMRILTFHSRCTICRALKSSSLSFLPRDFDVESSLMSSHHSPFHTIIDVNPSDFFINSGCFLISHSLVEGSLAVEELLWSVIEIEQLKIVGIAGAQKLCAWNCIDFLERSENLNFHLRHLD